MRESMVTRTVIGTKVTVLAMDTNTCEPANVTYEIGGQCINGEKLLNKVRKEHDTEDFKVVKIVDVEPFEKRYGMKESDFIAHAVELAPLPKRN
nr:MAG TPA: hypothetical protein [Caudoviricetes sp.]